MSRRTFLAAFAAVGIPLFLPKGIRQVAGAAMPTAAATAPAAPAAQGAVVASVAAIKQSNDNYDRLQRIVGRVVKSKSGNTMVWTERDPSAENGMRVMVFKPETPLEWGKARELDRVSRWRSWRTEDDLRALLAAPGPWVVRFNIMENYCFLTVPCAGRLLSARDLPDTWYEQENAFSAHLPDAARLSSEEALDLIPRLMNTYPHEDLLFFEPIRPEQAFVDLRLLQLNPDGWGPRVYKEYDLADLARVFHCTTPLVPDPRHPFLQVSDGFVALVNFDDGPGKSGFDDPWTFRWTCGCPAEVEDAEPSPCACFPPDMCQHERMLFVHLFARRRREGPFTYLGLGHLDCGVYGRTAVLRLAPALSRSVYGRLGGYVGWQARLEGNGPDEPPHRLGDHGDPEPYLHRLSRMAKGCLSLERFGTGIMWARVVGERAIIRFQKCGGERFDSYYWIDPAYAGDPRADEALDAEDDYFQPARAVVPRGEVPYVFRAFHAGDGELPLPERWTKDPYNENPATESNQPD